MTHRITRSTPSSRVSAVTALILLVALAAAPVWASSAQMLLMGEFFIYLALACLWNLLAGYAGLVSIGQQAYVGLGGYVLFTLSLILGIHPLLAIPVVGLISAVFSIPVAALVFRLQGAYLVGQTTGLGGGSGISLPTQVTGQLGRKALREASISWVALALGAGCLALVYTLLRSRICLVLTAIRDSEIASASLAVPIAKVKYGVYIFAAGMTAMIGALISLQKLRISRGAVISVNDWTAFVIFIVVIGGIGTIGGLIIGSIVYFLLREFIANFGSIYLFFLGSLAIVVILVTPKGIWGYVSGRFGWSLFPVGHRITWKD